MDIITVAVAAAAAALVMEGTTTKGSLMEGQVGKGKIHFKNILLNDESKNCKGYSVSWPFPGLGAICRSVASPRLRVDYGVPGYSFLNTLGKV